MYALQTKTKAALGIKTTAAPYNPPPWELPPAHHAPQRNPSADSEFDFQPKPLPRVSTMHSRYVQMLLEVDTIPKLHTVLASFFVWLLLAGFLVFPGTFTTISKSIEANHGKDDWADKTAESIYKSVKNIPLLVIGALICAASLLGMTFLAFLHMKNYVWLLNKLLVPGMANCLAGLISTLVGVYSQQNGVWSATAKVTAIVEGVCLAICGGLWFFVDHYLLEKVKEVHSSHYNNWSKDTSEELGMPKHF